MNQVKTSSFVNTSTHVQEPGQHQVEAPTWLIIIVLICALVVLKKFIYIKDPKRNGK